MPGALPVLNKRALEFAIRAALALNCSVADYTKFDRKNYFYPDLPKGYQISQYDCPIGSNGYMDVDVNGESKRIRIKRVHLEEETAKLMHAGDDIISASHSLLDFNRSGIPLIEIVSEADMRSADEARAYLTKLRSILLAIGVSDCKMEEGSMRCEANISVMPRGSEQYGTLVELKNIASFRAVHRAIQYEAARQIEIVSSGGEVARETRHWDDAKGETAFMRGKEEAHDYRYFPEPDLGPIVIDRAWVEKIRVELPELPDAKAERYMREWDLPKYDACQIADSADLSDLFEKTCAIVGEGREVAKWILGEVMASLNATGIELSESKLTPELFAELIDLMTTGKISGKIAKSVFEDVFSNGRRPSDIVKERGLLQISDVGELVTIVEKVIDANPGPVADYHAGKERALGFLVGQVMKETRGRANPQETNRILREELDKRA